MSNNHDTARLERSLAQVRAIRHVGGKIIDFLAQLEDFQKQLWLKKKFVLETHWCVTLDRIPEAMYAEIAANPAQRQEWIKLYAADESTGDLGNGDIGWQDPPDLAFLKANPYLVIDTRHFDRDFTDRLLASLSAAGPLDEQTDGLLIHGENFQALNLLQERYRGGGGGGGRSTVSISTRRITRVLTDLFTKMGTNIVLGCPCL